MKNCQVPYSAKLRWGKNLGKFGKMNTIRQYFTHIYVSFCNFTNIFPAKTLTQSKVLSSQNFTLCGTFISVLSLYEIRVHSVK